MFKRIRKKKSDSKSQKLPENLPDKRKMCGGYRKNKTDYNCNVVNDSLVEYMRKLPTIPASQTLSARMTPVGRVAACPESATNREANAPFKTANIKNYFICKALTQIKILIENEIHQSVL